MEPKQILERAKDTYLNCQSYEDSGSIVQLHLDGSKETQRVEISFKTRFRRAVDFEFEWKDPQKGTYKIWSEGERAYISSPQSGHSEATSLRAALAEAAGISYGATALVPAFLIDENAITKVAESSLIEVVPGDSLVEFHPNNSANEHNSYETKMWFDDRYTLRRATIHDFMSLEKQEKLLAEAMKAATILNLSLPGSASAPQSYQLVTDLSYREINKVPL